VSGRPWKPWLIKGHGTEARARKHYRDGDRQLAITCPPCAEAERRARWGRRHGPTVIPLPRDGGQ
jgi:hypothetical protein